MNVQLVVFGQSLSGNFTFQQTTTADGGSVVRVAVSGASLSLGSGATNVLSVKNGTGAFIVSAAGLAGSISVQLDVLNIPSFTFTSQLGLQINTTLAAVNEEFTVGADTVLLDLPAGPFVRVTAFNTQVTIAGNLFKGDFLFDQTTKSDGTKTTRVAIANGEVSIAGNGIKNAEGAFIATPGGVAGIISGDIAISAGGLSRRPRASA